ncbi:MAG: hypothetical protein KAT48_06385 [Bacteroidales bacterium]|nr:hypothetical protein [Bacteroidales bacterium]
MPVKLGRHGIESIIELDLNKDEKALLHESSKSVQRVMRVLDGMKIFD